MFSKEKSSKFNVNISSTFIARTKCKFCNVGPTHYYASKNPISTVSHREVLAFFNWVKKYYGRFCRDFYLFDDPSNCSSLKAFSHPVNYKGFRAKLHKNKGVSPHMDFVDCLVCDCGRTTWAFYQRSISNRKEVVNRKGRYGYKTIYEKY